MVPVPADDISNFIVGPKMPGDLFTRIFGFAGSFIALKGTEVRFTCSEMVALSGLILVTASFDGLKTWSMETEICTPFSSMVSVFSVVEIIQNGLESFSRSFVQGY